MIFPTTNKKVLAIDIDDTLNKLMDYVMNYYNSTYDQKCAFEDFSEWDTTKVLTCCSHPDIFHELASVNPDFIEEIGLADGAFEFLRWAYEEFDTYMVTAGVVHSGVPRERWIKKNFPFFDTHRLVLLKNKQLFKADYVLDDAPHNLHLFPTKNFLIDKPWNRDSTCFERGLSYTRIKKLSEFKDFYLLNNIWKG